MTDLLGIGSSALRAYQSALAAVGENVANAQTPGYARRRITLQEVAVSGSGDIAYKPQVMFAGVTAAGVTRAWDNFKASEARFSASADGRASVRQQWLTGIETALDDGIAGVGQAMTGFFTAAASLASDPEDRLGRRAVLTALDNVASAFRTSGQALGRLSDGIGQAAELEVTSLNDALKALDAVNGALGPADSNGSARASLEDERDRLADVAQQVADRRNQLDVLAHNFTTMVNDWAAAGEDANGNPGAPMISILGSATTIQALVTDPDLVPAASPGGSANGNLLALDAT